MSMKQVRFFGGPHDGMNAYVPEPLQYEMRIHAVGSIPAATYRLVEMTEGDLLAASEHPTRAPAQKLELWEHPLGPIVWRWWAYVTTEKAQQMAEAVLPHRGAL